MIPFIYLQDHIHNAEKLKGYFLAGKYALFISNCIILNNFHAEFN